MASTGARMQLTAGLRRAVQVRGDGLSTIDAERRRTWRETADRVARLATGLQALGMQADDRVAVLALNSDRFFEAFFGVLWAGGVIVPLNIRFARPELVYSLDDSGSRILIVDDAFRDDLAAVADQLETVEHVIFAGDGAGPPDSIAYEALLAQSEPGPDADRGGDDLAGIVYTGGTTGRSKGVMLSHGNLAANAMNTVAQLELGPTDIYLHAAPMFHLADGLATWAVTMVAGTHVFVPRFEPVAVLHAVQEHEVNFVVLVPTMLQMLVDSPEHDRFDLSSWTKVFYGASPMPVPLLRRGLEMLPACRFWGAYGMTELAPIATILGPEYHRPDSPPDILRSVGQVILGHELRIVDENDTALPPGAVGEIVVRGPSVMQGYWNLEEETRRALRGGWMHSGDVAYMDDNGFVYIVDRAKDMIVTGGENVYTAEVERAIYEHPGVSECAVIAVPSEQWGEAVHAIVVRQPGCNPSEREIIAHCHEQIAGYKCPRTIEFREAPLPLSGAGKVLKNELREPYWQGRKRRVH